MIRPTKQYFPFRGYPNIGLLLFGRNLGATDWSLSDITRQRDLAGEKCELAHKIAAIAKEHGNMEGITTLYAPNLDFSGRIAGPEAFMGKIMLSLPPQKLVILRDKGSDGLEIPKGTAALLTGADCPFVLFFLPKAARDSKLLATHCARWSLLNEAWILGKKDSKRHYEGIVENAMSRLGEENASDIRVHIACSIAGKHFRHSVDHPRYGKQNEKLIEYAVRKWGAECFVGNLNDGRLDLPTLIRAQCRAYKIPDDNVSLDREDTFSSTEPGSSGAKWWSHVRATERPYERKDREKRNMAIIIHR